jgi:hypothetical protein
MTAERDPRSHKCPPVEPPVHRDLIVRLGVIRCAHQRELKNGTDRIKLGGNKYSIWNIQRVISAFSRSFPAIAVRNVSFEGSLIKDVVDIVQKSDIFIALPGSDLLNAIFLPRRSSILVPCRKFHFVRQLVGGSDEIRMWLTMLPYLRSVEVCGQFFYVRNDGNWPHINVTTLVNHMKFVISDWHRRI